MEKITSSKRNSIVKLYFHGLSFDQIGAKVGVSKGTAVNVVTELKAGHFAEAADLADHIDQLRELSVDLAKLKLTPAQSVAGVALLARIYELGLEPSDIERWPLLLNSIKSEDDAHELIEMAYTVRSIQQKTGLSLPGLESKVQELEKKAYELQPLVDKVDDLKKQMAGLTKQREDLVKAVGDLQEKMKWLLPRVKELEEREEKLLKHTEKMESSASQAKKTITALNAQLQKLQKIGLSQEALAKFNEKVWEVAKRHGIKPAEARERLMHELKLLDKCLGLETILKSKQQQLKEIEHSVEQAKSERESLQAAVASLQQEKSNQGSAITAMREKVSQEIAQVVPIAKDTVKQVAEGLQSGCQEALAEVRLLKEESIELGKEVGKCEEALNANQWLQDLLALVRGEQNVAAQRVKVIATLVARGIGGWLRQHSDRSPDTGLLSMKWDQLTGEVERWKE